MFKWFSRFCLRIQGTEEEEEEGRERNARIDQTTNLSLLFLLVLLSLPSFLSLPIRLGVSRITSKHLNIPHHSRSQERTRSPTSLMKIAREYREPVALMLLFILYPLVCTLFYLLCSLVSSSLSYLLLHFTLPKYSELSATKMITGSTIFSSSSPSSPSLLALTSRHNQTTQ